jgi:hypothetical protein
MTKLIAVFAFVLALLVAPASSLAAPPEGSGLPLTVSPPALSFEKTTVGNQAPSLEVSLYNGAEEEAAIDKVAIEGEDAAAFNLNNSCGAVYPLQSCGLWFSFMPNSPGEKHATAVITFKDGRPAQTFAISGTAVEPQLTFSPSSYDFGLQRVYENRNTYFQLTNSGEAAVQVNNIEMLGGSGSFWNGNTNCWSGSLQPGQSCGIEVSFSAQDAVAYTADLRVTANSYGFTAALSGQGGRAVIDANPNPADFGALTVGAKGAVQTITLTNSGNLPAGFFIGIVAGGDSGSFQLVAENCSGELQPAASCSAQVRFTPLSAGAKTARLAFFGDSDAGAQVMLTGTGVAPAARLVPLSFDFGTQVAGSKSDSRAFVVRNDGTTALDLGTVAIAGADLDQFALSGDECAGETLAPGAKCLVRVRFAPDGAGAKVAKLRVISNSGAFVAMLSGTGTDALAAADDHRDGAFPHFGPPPPPRPWYQGRYRRFVRGETLRAGKLERPRRVKVRASTVPR